VNIGAGYPVAISEVGDDVVTFDTNHPLAGETLNFEVELLNITRLDIKHKDKFNVFFDIAIDDKPAGRITMEVCA
jgi:peptidyl-prolyl isomerase F (cyclophilin D)